MEEVISLLIFANRARQTVPLLSWGLGGHAHRRTSKSTKMTRRPRCPCSPKQFISSVRQWKSPSLTLALIDGVSGKTIHNIYLLTFLCHCYSLPETISSPICAHCFSVEENCIAENWRCTGLLIGVPNKRLSRIFTRALTNTHTHTHRYW